MLNVSNSAEPADLAGVFAALGDPTRLSLILKLGDGEALSISELSNEFSLTRQAVTKHLHTLEAEHLVLSERIGRETRFTLQPNKFEDITVFLQSVSQQWDQALLRLQAHVERE